MPERGYDQRRRASKGLLDGLRASGLGFTLDRRPAPDPQGNTTHNLKT